MSCKLPVLFSGHQAWGRGVLPLDQPHQQDFPSSGDAQGWFQRATSAGCAADGEKDRKVAVSSLWKIIWLFASKQSGSSYAFSCAT